MDLVFGIPIWLAYLVMSLLLVYAMMAAGWVLAKAGRSPLWAFLLLVPWVNVAAIWVFAFVRWPFVDTPAAPPVSSSPEP
jgi:hypothetical protein